MMFSLSVWFKPSALNIVSHGLQKHKNTLNTKNTAQKTYFLHLSSQFNNTSMLSLFFQSHCSKISMLWVFFESQCRNTSCYVMLLGEALRPGLSQLCKNAMGHLTTCGIYPALQVLFHLFITVQVLFHLLIHLYSTGIISPVLSSY